MLLRLLRGRRGRLGRLGQARSETGASQAGASQAGASQAGASQAGTSQAGTSQAGRPGSHRKTKPSAAGGWPSNRARSGLSVAPRETAAGGSTPSSTAARAAIRVAPDAASAGLAQQAQRTPPPKSATVSNGQPWYATAASNGVDLGLRDCGALERVLIREWDADTSPSPETVAAINRLAGLPKLIKEKLAAGLDAIHVGDGGVPDLDQMGDLKGVPLPSGRSTWDACAGAYGDRKIIVGSRPSPTPDVTCHEVGHALDDLDGAAGLWQSDLADFTALYDRCLPHLAIDFHRRDGAFSRREFFADSFAAIASAQRPALVEMLSGNTRSALDVMLYFNVRYGI